MLAGITTAPAAAEPNRLNLSELDALTAGNSNNPAPNGGAIVGNGSNATLKSSGIVEISDNAQADSRARNLVNSSESTVANGVNVFDSRNSGASSLDGAGFDLSQQNLVLQDQRQPTRGHTYWPDILASHRTEPEQLAIVRL